MSTNYRPAFATVFILAATLLMMGIQISGQTTDRAAEIVIGEISGDPIEAVEEAQPLADYLAANLEDYGIVSGRVVVADDMDEMIALFEDGEVDLWFDSVFPATVVSDLTGAEIFIRRWKKGVEEYHTVIFTSADSGITSLADLPGHMIAFEEDFSTSGYMLPFTYLVQEGLTPAEKEDMDDRVDPDEVGYIFSDDNDNTVLWVFEGRVDVGAIENTDFEDLDPGLIDLFTVLAETEAMPRHVGVMRAELDSDLAEAITVLLQNAHEDENAQDALEAFSKTSQFDDFPEGIVSATTRMRELLAILEDPEGIEAESTEEPSEDDES